MKLTLSLISLITLTSASIIKTKARETQAESAIHTRELIQHRSYGVGVLSTSYNEDTAPSPEFVGLNLALQEYFAITEDGSGDLLLLAMPISTVFRNAMGEKNNMTMTISDQYGFGDGNLVAGRYRVALFGTLSRIPESEVDAAKATYLSVHPDARGWIGAGGPHYSYMARLTVQAVYAFGGFGNAAWIGWLPIEMYRDAGKLMRNEKESRANWPIPEQPEEGDFGGERLFSERFVDGGEGRFKIQT